MEENKFISNFKNLLTGLIDGYLENKLKTLYTKLESNPELLFDFIEHMLKFDKNNVSFDNNENNEPNIIEQPLNQNLFSYLKTIKQHLQDVETNNANNSIYNLTFGNLSNHFLNNELIIALNNTTEEEHYIPFNFDSNNSQLIVPTENMYIDNLKLNNDFNLLNHQTFNSEIQIYELTENNNPDNYDFEQLNNWKNEVELQILNDNEEENNEENNEQQIDFEYNKNGKPFYVNEYNFGICTVNKSDEIYAKNINLYADVNQNFLNEIHNRQYAQKNIPNNQQLNIIINNDNLIENLNENQNDYPNENII